MARLLEHRFASIAILVFCIVSTVRFLAVQYYAFPLLGEVGYGDLYVFASVTELQQTGVMYPDPTRNLPHAYGPLLYLLLALPGRFISGGNPLLGLRLIVAGAFLLCLVFAASITHVLARHRNLWLWSPALALTLAVVPEWVFQLRGDFMSIALNLLAVRLLLFRNARAAMIAGGCAGLATQFKFTYVGALAAGLLWLAANRRWKHLALFSFAGITMSAGLYGLFLLREPRMLQNLLVLQHPIIDAKSMARFAVDSLATPAMSLGLCALPFLRWRLKSGWTLLILFVGISFAIAVMTDLQVGGNINYFFEAQIAVTPLCALAILRLHRSEFSVAGLFLGALLLLGVTPKIAADAYHVIQGGSARTAELNRNVTVLRDAFRDRSVLALATDAGFSTRNVVISDPWLATHLERVGKFDLHPLAGQIRNKKFDVIVVPAKSIPYRGVEHISPTLHQAISDAYRPYCATTLWVMMLRRDSAAPEDLGRQFAAIGCDFSACTGGPACRSW